jgi:hypothetical protein
VTLFESYSFASAPAPAKADRRTPEAPALSPPPRKTSGRRLWSLVGWLGLATYAFGLPVILAEYLPR